MYSNIVHGYTGTGSKATEHILVLNLSYTRLAQAQAQPKQSTAIKDHVSVMSLRPIGALLVSSFEWLHGNIQTVKVFMMNVNIV